MAIDLKRTKKTYPGVVDNVDAVHEIFKHLDAETLAVASCVSRRWNQAAIDDNLWEVICTKQWPATGISIGRLRSVVNVLGGFRRLYVKWLHPLRRHAAAACKNSCKDIAWSEDQVQLSLSLFSVEYYEKLGSFRNNGSCYTGSCTLSNPTQLRKVQTALCIPIQGSSSGRS